MLEDGTRSSLLWECERIIRAVKPKYLLMENVKNLGRQKAHTLILSVGYKFLEMMGYQNYWQSIKCQKITEFRNRERVFVVSILGLRTISVS